MAEGNQEKKSRKGRGEGDNNEKKVEKCWYIGNLYPLLAIFSISLKLFRNRKCKHCDVPVLGELWELGRGCPNSAG